MTEEKIVSMEEALKVYENVNGNETLKVYKDRFEIVRIRNKQEVTAIYRYYNVKSVCADKFMKGDRIVVKLVDNNELFFFLTNASTEEYHELATLLAELKENAPTIEELGISVEEGLQELKDNKEKSKSELIKKIGKFVSEYKNFKELTLMNKVLHIVVPIVCLILLVNIFGGGYKYKSVEEFQEAFCYNIGEKYSSDEWAVTTAEESGSSYDTIAYDDGYGNVMLIVYYEDDEVVAAGISDDMTYLDVDTEFLWKCATVSAMLGCDMDEATNIVQEANWAHNDGETVVELDDGIRIYPHMPNSNISFFSVATERFE